MRTWNLIKGDPLQLTLAADFRFSQPDYANDHIWEVLPGGGEPAALTLHTTFGLRALSMRVFPRFIRNNVALTNPAEFHAQPAVSAFYPNYLALKFYPYPEITALLELWVPSSQTLTGRIRLSNASIIKQNFTLEWVCLLTPLANGEAMSWQSSGVTHFLQGKTKDLAPVFTLTGGAMPAKAPYPALALDFDLLPGNYRSVSWALATLDDPQASLDLARRTAARRMDAEIARVELENTSQMVEIHTGNPDWDAALTLAQKCAYGLIFPAGNKFKHPSAVLSRQPDHGFSLRGNGGDYGHLWSGLTPLDTWYLASLLPGAEPSLRRGFIENYLAQQEQNGFIDLKPGIAGQSSRQLAQPLLATLCWQAHRLAADDAWLKTVYPALMRFLRFWFTREVDRDQDGFPEWQHPAQTGLPDAPLYNPTSPEGQRVDLNAIESPSLAAFLYKECECLLAIARHIGEESDLSWLEEVKNRIQKQLDLAWDAAAKVFRYRDVVSHQSTGGQKLVSFKGSGSFEVKRQPKVPARLVIQLHAADQGTRAGMLKLYGQTASGVCVEEVPFNKWIWLGGRASHTTQNIFTAIERIEIQGLPKDDQGTLEAINYRQEDISLFLPLWAGVASRDQAARMVDLLTSSWFSPYGIPLQPGEKEDAPISRMIYPWNQLIGEGLLAYGYRQEAADLLTRLVNAGIQSLKESGHFGEYYHAHSGAPGGERDHLWGLAPVGLFLKTLGVWNLAPNQVILVEQNPFPNAITVKYRGMTIVRHAKDTVVSFAAGQTITVEGAGTHLIQLPDS